MTDPVRFGTAVDLARNGTAAAEKDAFRRGSLAIGYCFGSITPTFHQAMIQFMGADRDQQWIGAVINSGGLYIEENRNLVVQQFLTTSCEWLWFLDTDVGFPVDAVRRLYEASDRGTRKIVAAAYWGFHSGGNYATWMKLQSDGLHAYKSIAPTGVHRLGACGMGCTLIHRDVFEGIRDHRRGHDDPWVWFGRDIVEVEGKPERTGEDISFCIRAAKAGYATYGLADLVVDHYKLQAVAVPRMTLPEAVPVPA